MLHRVRTALLWLSLLALPLHGMAGNAMLVCMPEGHGTMALMTPMQAASCGDAAAAPAGSTMPVADVGDGHDGKEWSPLPCGAGSMCSSSAALPAVALAVPDTGPAMAPSSFVSTSAIGFFTSGPDRPPRPAFA